MRILIILAALSLTACAKDTGLMRDGKTAPAPKGYVEYCKRNPEAPIC